ncbi:MAG: CZB domain-containing protein [Phenylobacterium sp.]|nr:CZB domain-containing protein [Phenylobacterium sp.]
MNLDNALAAHADWKVKLRVALADHATLDAETLASDCKCQLGLWLHGEGRAAHGASANFKTCVTAHADFHRAAGAIARAINAKDYAAAEQQLDVGTAFATASSAVAVAVRRLKVETQAAA